jgi:4-hydroxybenzoate polyprenyltransferase
VFQKIIHWIQFSNIFIATCALANCIGNLSFFSNIKLPIVLYITIFLSVIWYYNLAYQKISNNTHHQNQRTIWLTNSRKKLFTIQATLLSFIAIFSFILSPNLVNFFNFTTLWQQLILLSFVALGIFYNFGLINKKSSLSIRKIAFLKPLCIAYVWMGVTLVLPYTFFQISNQKIVSYSSLFWIIFFEGIFTITLLAILYDVKDFEADNAVSLKTWAVKLGVNNLFKKLILPAVIVGTISILIALQLSFITLNTAAIFIITYVAIAITSKTIQNKRSIIWHLTVIDGIILLKSFAIILLNKM